MSRCPHCLGKLPEPPPESCPRCERPVRDPQGRVFTPLDVSWERVVGEQEAAVKTLLTTGTPIVALVSLALPLAHALLTPAAVASMMVLGHLVVVNLTLGKKVRPYLSRTRRFFQRWIVRLVTVTLGLWGYTFTLVPVFGGVAGAVTFASLTLFAYRYGLFALSQERARAPLTWWEKAILVVFSLAALATLALLLFATLLLTWLLGKLNLFAG